MYVQQWNSKHLGIKTQKKPMLSASVQQDSWWEGVGSEMWGYTPWICGQTQLAMYWVTCSCFTNVQRLKFIQLFIQIANRAHTKPLFQQYNNNNNNNSPVTGFIRYHCRALGSHGQRYRPHCCWSATRYPIVRATMCMRNWGSSQLYGHHGLSCRHGSGRHSPQNRVKEILCRAFNSAGA